MHWAIGMRPSGNAETVERIGGRYGKRQGVWVGVADVFAGEDHHAATEEPWVFAAFEHAESPVEGAVGARSAKALDERRDHVVVVIAGAVVDVRLGVSQKRSKLFA